MVHFAEEAEDLPEEELPLDVNLEGAEEEDEEDFLWGVLLLGTVPPLNFPRLRL